MNISAKNLNALINDSLAIEFEGAKSTGNLGFMARALVQATLPHKKIPGNEYTKTNGCFSLTILAPQKTGLPYGNIPRLLLAWISTEAVRTKQREIILGESMTKFMKQLDLASTGGPYGTITRLKDQMTRLFSSSFSCTYDDGKNWAIKNVIPISETNLWWEHKKDTQSISTLTLNKDFFTEITNNPVPIDIRVLKTLKRSPLALDIYCWLTYRMSYLKKIACVNWATLQYQFGTNYCLTQQGKRDFKKAAVKELKKITFLYKNLNIDTNERSLILKPSHTHVLSR